MLNNNYAKNNEDNKSTSATTRIIGEKQNIDSTSVKEFFKKRAGIHDDNKPYITVLYQDNNPELAATRDENEKNFIFENLELNSKGIKLLEMGCGHGRIARFLSPHGETPYVDKYMGFDFSQELIDIANERYHNECFHFQQMTIRDLGDGSTLIIKPPFNRIILAGVCLYLNDDELIKGLSEIDKIADKKTIFYIREPLAIKERLTLKEYYSDELQAYYNAIYRTRDEYVQIFQEAVLKCGFKIEKEGFMHPESVSNRTESAVYYFLLKRSI